MSQTPLAAATPAEAATCSGTPATDRAAYPFLRWGLLTGLVLIEVIAVSLTFDAAARAGDPGWAGAVIHWSPAVLRWVLVVGFAAAVLGFWFLGDEIRAAARTAYSARVLSAWVLVHLAAYALFVCVSWRVLSLRALQEPLTAWELVAWLAAGGATAGTWALAALPWRAWTRLLWQARWILMAAGFVGFAASLAAHATREGWDVLSGPTMWASHALLGLLTSDVVFDPDARLLGTSRFPVEVGIPCSGYEGIGLIAAYLGGYLILFRRDLRFPHALFLLPLGLAAIWTVNVGRIVLLILIGDRISADLAINGFHSQAGWLGFNVVALSLVYFAHQSHLFLKDPARHEQSASPAAAYLAPLLAAVAVQMLTAAFVPDREPFYPVRAVVAGLLLAYFWRHYSALRNASSTDFATNAVWGIGTGIVVFLVWIALVHPPAADQPASSTRGLSGWPPWAIFVWFLAKAVGFVLITPLAEELAFRGYLMRRLVARDFEAIPIGRFTWPSFLISSASFGLLHGEWLAGMLAGMGYALVVYRTGRLRDAVVAHAVTNALLFAMMAYTGQWQE